MSQALLTHQRLVLVVSVLQPCTLPPASPLRMQGVNFESLVFDGATHDEAAWSARLDVPLCFLYAANTRV